MAHAGERQCALGKDLRFLQEARHHLCFTQSETTARLAGDHFRCHGLFQRRCEQQHRVGATPGQVIRRAQGRSHQREAGRPAHVLTEAHSPLQQGDCPGGVALAEG